VSFIRSTEHARFGLGYAALWNEFGDRNEMEQPEVIAQRMHWRPEVTWNDHALLYEMVVVTHGDDLAAVRDHTAIVDLAHPEEPVVVHLSHLLILPEHRGTGLTGWLRALPIRTARECLHRAHQAPRPITLLAEMEPADARSVERQRRLAAYEKVGFLKIDPRSVHYLQPDFRTPDQIDAAGGPMPLPLSLIIRRVKQEQDREIPGHEVRSTVESLYTMYARSFRERDMVPNWESLKQYPADHAIIPLVPPTRVD